MVTRFNVVLALGLVLLASPLASLACCPSGGNDPARIASRGLGESQPASAIDVAENVNWRVYEFQRDGIRYVQANDSAGNVRAAVGRIGDTFWVLPIGVDADRVSVPGTASMIPSHSSANRVYSTKTLEVWVYQTAKGDWWELVPAGTR